MLQDHLLRQHRSIVAGQHRLSRVNLQLSSRLSQERAFFWISQMLSKWPNRYSNPVALHCRTKLCRTAFSRIWRGVARELLYIYIPLKGPVAPTFSVPEGGVALQVASWESWKVLRCKEVVVQLHCCLSRYTGPLGVLFGSSGQEHKNGRQDRRKRREATI